ncbi:hypothetical protein MPDQ_000649 [Monascus purpureus]|uniref:Uncharacterized protein n=1 Tax=Monascus purpureus TaxID=5098 RepID=A0A507QPE7_MONPU|nr:hypothetical protein MPDQ_000649 [Monascus purpureus]
MTLNTFSRPAFIGSDAYTSGRAYYGNESDHYTQSEMEGHNDMTRPLLARWPHSDRFSSQLIFRFRHPGHGIPRSPFLTALRNAPVSTSQRAQTSAVSIFPLRKVCSVTGGARGIGLEVARSLAEAGVDVALVYSSTTDAIENAAKIAADTGVRVQAFQSDVTSWNEIAAIIERRLDVAVANAGTCTNSPALEYTEETWQREIRVNYDGVMWTAQAAYNGKLNLN